MPMPNYARLDRAVLCDTLVALGPDQPTLCTGWSTRDLAAHLVVRERRPDAAAGILLGPLAAHLSRVQSKFAQRPFDKLVVLIREPSRWSPMTAIGPLDRLTNTAEFFIHTEDIRRAQPEWRPRTLSEGQFTALWGQIRAGVRTLREFPAALELVAPGYGSVHGGAGGPSIKITGNPGELMLFVTGRQRASRVELSGPNDLVARLCSAETGI
jgi:uncharacterized protein (TIGR03085 family)